MPRPFPNEDQDEFIERCMHTRSMIEDYPDAKARAAAAFAAWREARGAPPDRLGAEAMRRGLDRTAAASASTASTAAMWDRVIMRRNSQFDGGAELRSKPAARDNSPIAAAWAKVIDACNMRHGGTADTSTASAPRAATKSQAAWAKVIEQFNARVA